MVASKQWDYNTSTHVVVREPAGMLKKEALRLSQMSQRGVPLALTTLSAIHLQAPGCSVAAGMRMILFLEQGVRVAGVPSVCVAIAVSHKQHAAGGPLLGLPAITPPSQLRYGKLQQHLGRHGCSRQ